MSVASLFGVMDVWGHLGAYLFVPFLDIITHFLFGFGFALILIYTVCLRDGIKIFLLIGCTGLLWEGVEFAYDHLLAFPYGFLISQHGLDDTLVDLISNSAGALFSMLLFRREMSKGVQVSVSEPE